MSHDSGTTNHVRIDNVSKQEGIYAVKTVMTAE
jgi:hypothetical protein